MRPSDVLGIVAGIAGGLPPLHLPKRRERKPDPVAEAAAAAKRARKAAKRAEDERRTAEGRASYTPPAKLGFERSGWFTGWSVRLAQWDGAPYEMEWPRWRIRSRERRALPGMERPWHCSPKQMLHALSKLFNGRPSRYIVMENAHHAWRSAL